VEQYEKDLATNLSHLLQRLQSRTYVLDPYEQLAIRKEKGDQRILSLATVEDKVVQFVVKEYLERRAQSIFLDCSYAYRPGKGHGKAIARVTHCLREDSCVLVCDIYNFFDSISHLILLRQLGDIVSSEQIMHLLELWIITGSIRKGGLVKRTCGIV
jgi:retron-type reverse transcriptase